MEPLKYLCISTVCGNVRENGGCTKKNYDVRLLDILQKNAYDDGRSIMFYVPYLWPGLELRCVVLNGKEMHKYFCSQSEDKVR